MSSNPRLTSRAVTPVRAADDSVHHVAASQRVQSRVPAPQRSVVPTVPGIPAGAAVGVAVALTFLGFLIDLLGGSTELTNSFSALYVLGCVAAVCAVRFRGLFTTMVLPPLLLFMAVPLAYRQLTGSADSLKDILLNLAIPLVHRFPAMMIATTLVLLIAGVRIARHRSEKAAEPRRGSSWGRGRGAAADRPRRTRGAAERRPKRPESGKRGRRPEDIEEPARRSGRRRPAPAAEAPPPAAAARGRDAAQGRGRAPRGAAPRPDEPVRATSTKRRGEPPAQPARVREPIRPDRRRNPEPW